MEQHLQFKIGSTFSGEGFTKLKQEVGNANRAANQAASAASRAAGAMGGLDTAGSKAAGAVTGLVQALLTGGVQGVLFAGAMMALNAYIGKLKESLEQAQERAEKLKASIKSAFSDTTSGIKSGIAKEIADISTRFDQITKNAVAFTNAIQGLSASQSGGNIINLEIEKYNAMLAAGTDAEAKHIEAVYNLKIAEENAAKVANDQSVKVGNATTARVNAESKVAALTEEYAKIAREVKSAEEAYKIATEEGADNRKDLAKFVKDLKAQQDDVSARQLQAQNDVTVLTLQEQTAIQDQTNALAKSRLATQKASDALDSLSKQIGFTSSEFVESFIKSEEAEALKAAEKEKSDALKSSSEAEREAAEAARNLKEAQANLAAAIRAYEDNYTQNRIWEEVSGASGNGVNGNWRNLNEAGNSKLIQEGAAVIAGERALANGAVRTVEDLRKVEQQAMRDAREEMSSKETAQMMREAERADRLRKMSDKAMSQADRDWLAKYDDVKNANDAQQREVEAAKMKQMFAKWREEDAQEAVIEINQRLKKLGLK